MYVVCLNFYKTIKNALFICKFVCFRIDVAKSMGLKIIEATFTSHISQGVAEKCGYETIADVPYREFEKTMDFDFKTVSTSIKIMAYVVK